MINSNLIWILLTGCSIGAAAGYLGSFMVLKRMSLVGDALSHVALPGIAIALMLHAPPLFGAFIALGLAVLGVWYFQNTSTVYPEALVGLFFTFSLAVGILITPEPELLEALFGNLQKITPAESLITIFASILVILITKVISKKIILGVISEELSRSINIPTKWINLLYLALVGTVVALGVQFVGTLLTGALVIIPAAASKNIAKGLNSYYLWSIIFGVLSAILGLLASSIWHLASGPLIILSGITIFLTTFLLKKTINSLIHFPSYKINYFFSKFYCFFCLFF